MDRTLCKRKKNVATSFVDSQTQLVYGDALDKAGNKYFQEVLGGILGKEKDCNPGLWISPNNKSMRLYSQWVFICLEKQCPKQFLLRSLLLPRNFPKLEIFTYEISFFNFFRVLVGFWFLRNRFRMAGFFERTIKKKFRVKKIYLQ